MSEHDAGSEAARTAAAPLDRATDHVPEPEDEAPPTGPRRVLIALYAIFALAATARAVVQLTTQYSQAPLAYVLSLFSGIVYIAATVGLVTDRPWSRPLAWTACGTELVGVITIGIASLVDPAAFPHDTVWSKFGSGYGFIPLVLPMLGLSWLYQTRRDRHEEAAAESQPDPE